MTPLRLALLLLLVPGLAAPRSALANALARDHDPVVLTGAETPSFLGASPDRLVAFRFDAAWVQVPVQVDERAAFDFGRMYGGASSGYALVTYADTSTFTGPDPDPAIDADDEIALRAADAGPRAIAGAEPAGVVSGSGVEVSITNTLTSAVAYVYLFESDGSLDPAAGVSPIAYAFTLLSGAYKTTYDTGQGPNPENSTVTTAAYAVHFADRWIRDRTSVTAGGATGVDLLDRHKALFAPGVCVRTEETFSNGEGCFIVNRAGPVRALRGYAGANSGPTTWRLHAFYAAREDVVTGLRVHPISGIMDYFDYAPAASGMTYWNAANPLGVTVDGAADAVTQSQLAWEGVSGVQGTLVIAHDVLTDIPGFTWTSYYSDAVSPPSAQCTGDASEYGASGLWVNHAIPNTDPGVSPTYNVLEATRRIAYEAPSLTGAAVAARAAELSARLTATATPWQPTGVAAAPWMTFTCRVTAAAAREARLYVTLTVPATVSVSLHDVRGHLVRERLSRTLTAGPHEIALDVSHVPSGLYLVRVEADRAAVVRRLLVTR